MDILCCALALLGGVIGAGFASGREIVRFFAAHGAMGFIAVAFALAALLALFALLPIRLAAEGQTGLSGLCRARFGARVGGVCGALFFLLSAVTGGAMLAACAELSALVWPIRHAYALGFAVTAVLARCFARLKRAGWPSSAARCAVFCPFCSSGCCFFRRAKPAFCRKGRRTPFSARRWTACSTPR
ncbi:MAG: hypothetical protein ACLTV6_09710 [Christensenellales bacterium]